MKEMTSQATDDQRLPEGVETVEINGYPMAYLERGMGPTVVFVHGSLGDYRTWTPQTEALCKTFRVVAVSLRRAYPERWDGIGGGFSIEQHALDVAAFIECVGAPVDLVAHSRGGVVAVEVARSRPELLRSLVLVEAGLDSLIRAENDASPDPVQRLASEVMQHFKSGGIDEGLRHFTDTANFAGAWDKLPEALKQRRRDNAWTLAAQANERRPNFNCMDLGRLAMPVLMFVGELSTARNKAITAEMRRCLPGAQLVTMIGAAHSMITTHSADFNAALSVFLRASGDLNTRSLP